MMSEDLSMRLARLAPPLPIAPVTEDVLAASESGVRHRNAVRAWEVTLQVMASAVWAVARRVGVRSVGFDQQKKGLRRPSMGHWAGLLREGASLLSGRKEAEALALAEMVGALHAKVDKEDPDLARLLAAMEKLPQPVKPTGKRVIDLIQAMTTYRSRSEGHPDERPPPAVLRDNADALVRGMLRVLELAPVIGEYRLVVAHRVRKKQSGAFVIERITMHGGRGLYGETSVGAEIGERLREGGLYLWHGDRTVLSLWPIAAAEQTDAGWKVGLLKSEVRGPLFSYAPFVDRAFRASLSAEEYTELLGEGPMAADDTLSEELLAMEPYRGLLAYDERHAPLYFGRAAEAADAVSILEEKGAVVICGASGSGKSSLMKAGIASQLRARASDPDRFFPLSFSPGADPIKALRAALFAAAEAGGETDLSAVASWRQQVEAALPAEGTPQPTAVGHLLGALAATGRSTVLCVDQMEEAATLTADEDLRRRFLDVMTHLLVAAKENGVPVVATVRADHLSGLLEHGRLRQAIQARLMLLGGLDRAALMDVITGPLKGRRVTIEPGLAEEIAADVGDEPGRLALLSQVLKSLWETRGRFGNGLTKAGYEAVGRVEGAVRDRAEARWAELDEASRRLLDRIFLRLANQTSEGFVRNRVGLAELTDVTGESSERVEAVLRPFVQDRLLVLSHGEAGETTVEVAHEALLRSWPHLADLLRSEQEAIGLRREVAGATRAWLDAGRSREHWTDASTHLRRAEELLEAGRLQLTSEERAFLSASRGYVARRRRWARIAVAALVVLTLTAAVAAQVALVARAGAEEEQKRAEALVADIMLKMRDKLMAVDRVDLLGDAAESVYRYYEKSPPEREDLEARRLYSLTMSTLGRVRDKQGRTDEAVRFHQRALAIDRELAEVAGSDMARSDLWVSLKSMASMQRRRGAWKKAIASFEEALEVAEERVRLEPGNDEARRHLVVAYEDLGRAHRRAGDPEEAIAYFEKAKTSAEELVKREPDNVVWLNDLVDEHRLIGDLRASQSRYEEAYASYQAARERLADAGVVHPRLVLAEAELWTRTGRLLVEEGRAKEALVAHEVALGRVESILSRQPMDGTALEAKAATLLYLARAKQAMERYGEARANLDEAYRIRKQLSRLDPTNAGKKRAFSVVINLLGDLLSKQGKKAEALEAYEEDLRLTRELVNLDPKQVTWRRDLSISLLQVGKMKLALGKTEEGLEALDRALEVRRILALGNEKDVRAQEDLALLLVEAGEARAKAGDRERAFELRREAVSVYEALVELAPKRHDLRHALGMAEVRLSEAHGWRGEAKARRDALVRAMVHLDHAFGMSPTVESYGVAAHEAFEAIERMVAQVDRTEAERIVETLAARGGALDVARASIELRIKAVALALDSLSDPQLAYQLSVPLREDFPQSMTVVCNHAEATFTAGRPYEELKREVAACDALAKEQPGIEVVTSALLFSAAVLEGHDGDRAGAKERLGAALSELGSGPLGWTLDGVRAAIRASNHPKAEVLEELFGALADAEPKTRARAVASVLARIGR